MIFIDKKRNDKSGETIKNQLLGKMQVFGQYVVWSQLNYETRNQLLTWPDGKSNPFILS